MWVGVCHGRRRVAARSGRRCSRSGAGRWLTAPARHGNIRTMSDDTDDNDRIVILAKRTGRVLGVLFVVYLIFSIGQQLKVW